ncbi:hypothetical protein AcV5_003003 [Taiwanofungus camphoratus]|nr:hypothetical protein AcV5_003003 [Antrodia cinnamomea]
MVMASHKVRSDVDEDLDDLDDVLEQFTPPPGQAQSRTQSSTATAAPSPSVTSASKKESDVQSSAPKSALHELGDPDLSEDFARELAQGMESLMQEIAGEAGLGPEGAREGATGESDEQANEEKKGEKALRAAWAILIEGMSSSLNSDGGESSKGKGKPGQTEAGTSAAVDKEEKEDTFQASIKKAMEKLKESDSNLQADAANSAPDSLDALLAQMGDKLPDSEESEEELQKLLESMMGELMSKNILYEPLKELHTKFPDYLKDNAGKINTEDKKRYDSQYAIVIKIIAVFEDPSYSDEDTQKSVQILELMSEMQSLGSPPAEIMGPLPPGLDLGPDGMPKLPEGCTIA